MNGRFKERKWMSEWQTREHSCELKEKKKGNVSDRQAWRARGNVLRWEKESLTTMQIYLSVRYGTESNWNTDWSIQRKNHSTDRWLTFTLLKSKPFFLLTLISVSIKRRSQCTGKVAFVQRSGTQFCNVLNCTVIIQLHKKVSQEEEQCVLA